MEGCSLCGEGREHGDGGVGRGGGAVPEIKVVAAVGPAEVAAMVWQGWPVGGRLGLYINISLMNTTEENVKLR